MKSASMSSPGIRKPRNHPSAGIATAPPVMGLFEGNIEVADLDAW